MPFGTVNVADWPTIWFRPRKISMPARVTMNAGTPTIATQKPCQAPMTSPRSRPATTASGHGTWWFATAPATTMPTKAATEPTDRSMCPAMITSAMPTARISTYAFSVTMLMMLSGVSSIPPVSTWNSSSRKTRAMVIPNWRRLLEITPEICLGSALMPPRPSASLS